jgi:pimeloyl-ACP methyl ester carboxylesterase
MGLTPAATKSQYVDGVRDPSRVSPDNWLHDQALLDRPGIDEIMLDLFKDYGSNVALYPQFQAFFRSRRPPTLIVWGKNDVIFPAEGATPYLRDLPDAELHLLDSGHFALEDKGNEIAGLMRDFLARRLPRN